MIENSKILTVSYGTFSCTLEGFDDSFDTMKAIAEYFRDLAGEDRYFGAEPPTPDAEMLARIAEREIARRVDAHEDQGKITLRASPEAAPVPAAPVPAPTVALPVAAAVAEVEPVAEPEAETALEELNVTDESADTLAAVSQALEAAPEAPEAEIVPEVEISVPVEAALEDTPSSETIETFFEGSEASFENVSEVDAEDDYEDAAEVEIEDALEEIAEDAPEDSTPVAREVPHPDPESVAAKLQRIRDVVSNPEAPAAFTEDEHAEDLLRETADEMEVALEQDDVAERARVETEDAALEDTATEDTATQDNVSDILSRLTAQNDFEADAPESYDDDDGEATELEAAEDEADAGDEVEEAETPLRARVIKMKRADFEAAVAEGQFEEVDDADSSLSDADEAELARELAEVAAELTGTEDAAFDINAEDSAEDDADFADEDDDEFRNILAEDDAEDAAEETQSKGRSRLTANDSDGDLSRLMQAADAQMDETDGKSRRNAIQHLRAAVAATNAEKSAGSDLGGDDDNADAYRDDLASVVRPRRPQAGGENASERSERPVARVAPLKLVAEQRIDMTPAEAVAPVRPRRVVLSDAAAAEPETTTDGDDAEGGFEEFAESMGATKLPDVLEAAAAYMSFVEGRDQFSRPQLMTKVRQVEKDDFSREDGLRTFGQLLRQGKIVKIKGGRFTASEQISFRPDARYAGE